MPVQLRALPLLAIGMGIALRLIEYFRDNSLWGDEAMLALSIASRSLRDLLHPLAYGQVAPIPFLWAERLLVITGGVNEWALRLLPCVAGIASCVLVWQVASRVLSSGEAFVTLVLTAFSQFLIRYSAEVKSYSLDALLTLAVLGATVLVMARPDDRRSWLWLTVIGTGAVVCSLTAPFVCAGAAIGLSVQAYQQRRLDRLPRVLFISLVWAAAFSALYITFYRRAGNSPYMRQFWGGTFLTLGAPDLVARARAAFLNVAYAVDPGSAVLGLSAVTLGLVIVGVVLLCRRSQTPQAVLLLVPGIAPLLASSLRLYPVASRLLLFAAPALIMLVGVGIVGTATWIQRHVAIVRPRWTTALLVLPTVTTGIASMFYPRDQQMRLLVQELRTRWRDREGIYVFHTVVPAWLFYSTDWSAPNQRQLSWAMQISGPGGVGHENGPSRGPRTAGEGSDLTYVLNRHPVLLGTSSGMQGRPLFGYSQAQPDPGWVRNESRRIRNAASPKIWLIIGNATQADVDPANILLNAMRAEGGRVNYRFSVEDGKLYYLDFSPNRVSQRRQSAGASSAPAAEAR
jgi:Dolichyl-phosphate-mannose-protein mannosyltransferase